MAEGSGSQTSHMFAGPPAERPFPKTAVAIGAAALVILVGVLVVLGHRKAAAPAVAGPLPLAAYAGNLAITGVEMSAANSQLGGTSTYVDGHIANHGGAAVTGVMAQVVFPNDDGTPPQMASTQMLLISSREPYIDTEMLSAKPLEPGAEADFRLIFESVPTNWNMHVPEIRLTQVSTR